MKKVMMLIAAVMIMVLGIGMSVMAASKEDGKDAISNEEYRVLEQECLQEVKQILLEKGCKNAGVTLTYVTDMDGNREYTVCVHHEKLNIMEADEYGLLQARIMQSVRNILFAKSNFKKI